MSIGGNLRKIRKQCHLTQDEVVAQLQYRFGLEISRGTYSQIEIGRVGISIEELIGLSKIYHCSIDAFFDGLILQEIQET